MILSIDIIVYKGFDIKRIEGNKIRNSMKNTPRGQLFSYKNSNPLVKYVEYSVQLGTWNYTTNRLRDVKDEIDSYIKNR